MKGHTYLNPHCILNKGCITPIINVTSSLKAFILYFKKFSKFNSIGSAYMPQSSFPVSIEDDLLYKSRSAQ